MKGFIKVNVTGNSTPVIVNVKTIAQVWNSIPGTVTANIKLTTKSSDGNHDIIRVDNSVSYIEAQMNAALQDNE